MDKMTTIPSSDAYTLIVSDLTKLIILPSKINSKDE